MDLKINKDFAKHYNDYRAKEEAAKTKKTLKREIKELEESSSSSDSEYNECYRNKFVEQCDDILRKIQADSKLITKLDGPLYKEIVVDVSKDKVEKPIYVKDLNRKILLDGGVDNEEDLINIEKYSTLDSEDILKSVLPNTFKMELDDGNLSNDDDDFLKPSTKPPIFKFNHVEQDTKESESETDSVSDVEEPEVPMSNKIEINRDRKLETVRVSKTKSRAEKRKTRKENKSKELKQKMKRLQELKNIAQMEKLNKIKKNVPELAKHLTLEDLDSDFDIDEFSKKMSSICDQEDADMPNDEEKPVFSDDSDIDFEQMEGDVASGSAEEEDEMKEQTKKPSTKKKVDNSESTKKKASYFTNLELSEENTSKKKVGIMRKTKEEFSRDKFSSFSSFLKKTFDIACEDIILGKDDSDDIQCKFKYRKVDKQTYGLDIEDIILADNKELNKWASLKKIVCLRSSYDEEKDQMKYSLPHMQEKKKEILASLYKEESEVEDEESKSETPKISKSSKNRLRKKAKKKQLQESSQQNNAENHLENENKSKNPQHDELNVENVPAGDGNKTKKKKNKEKKPETTDDNQVPLNNKSNEQMITQDVDDQSPQMGGKTSKKSKKRHHEETEPDNVDNKSKKPKIHKVEGDQISHNGELKRCKKGKKLTKAEKKEKYKTIKKKSNPNSIPVLNNNRLESLGINRFYYNDVLCLKENQN